MSKLRLILGMAWIAILAAVGPLTIVRAEVLARQIPPGFHPVLSAPGVELYQKEYANGTPDYVQVIDFSRGAGIQLLHGAIAVPGTGQGVYGGDNPRFQRQSLEKFWADFAAANPTALCITNGLFFYMPQDPPPLAYPLKVEGVILTDGYGLKEYPDQKLMLEIWPDRANITPLTAQALHTSPAPNLIAGLTSEANKRAKAVGRTFVGVADQNGDGSDEILFIFNTPTALQEKAAQVLKSFQNGDGSDEILFIFNTPTALQEKAAQVLKSFGAEQVMMLDGGGSTQLICQGRSIIASDRAIPQAVGVLAGPGPALPLTDPVSLEVTGSLAISRTLPMPGIDTLHLALPSVDDEPPGAQMSALDGQIDLANAAWIPVIIVPAAVLIFWVVRRNIHASENR